MTHAPAHIGQSTAATETTPLLRGDGTFVGDVALEAPLCLHVLRSPVASARLRIGDLAEARALPGVVAVHLASDLGETGALPVNPVLPLHRQPAFPLLAGDTVMAVGQPVAAILAETPAAAADAAELIELDYDSQDTEADTLAERVWQAGDCDAAFAEAAHVVEAQITHPVLAPSPMEPRGIAVACEPETGALTIYHSTQTPHRTRSALCAILGLEPDQLRVIAPHVGGAFGMKGSVYPEEVLAVWAARHHRRNVRWIATRSEEFLSATHGRGLETRGRLALDADGRFLALEAEVQAELGAWVPNSGLIPAWNAARVLPSGYAIDTLKVTTTAHLGPVPARGIYRGAGRPEANMLMERLVDEAAQATGLDPLEIRRRNLRAPDALPAETATGNRLDSGDYAGALDLLSSTCGYEDAIRSRDARRKQGELVGLGVCFYVEPSGEGWESARVTLDGDRAEIASGSSAQGQHRITAYAQIAADALGLPPEAITVRFGDTGTCPEGIGALASRSTAIGGSAVWEACRKAAARRDAGENGPIVEETRYETGGQAWGYGAVLAMLSVDADTGAITLERLDCVDDTGRVINPALVKGQILGGLAQGLGEALMEAVEIDADGEVLTGSFMDYAMPRADDMPPVAFHKMETPSPLNLLGAKGVGEAGTISAPAAILNAALDALRPLGVKDLTMPLTPCKVWAAMRDAREANRR